MTARPEILDTTLREGEQCFGVFFTTAVKKRIALLLDEIGVDFIEVGHPAAAPSIREAASAIAGLRLRAPLVGHARLNRGEILAVSELGLPWVGLFAGVNDRSLSRYGLSRRQVYQQAFDSVRCAQRLDLRIKFTCEDASRTDPDTVIDFFRFLHSIGVDRLSYADTLGVATPQQIRDLASRTHVLPPLHFHFHDDHCRAYANAVKALECGAQCIDTSILGIGERTGLVPIEDIIPSVNLKRNAGHRLCRTAPLAEATQLVHRSINQDHYRKRRFAHKSGIHIDGVLKSTSHYESIDPGQEDNERMLVMSKLIGRSGLRALLIHHGWDSSDSAVEFLLERVKADEFLELTDSRDIVRYFSDSGLKKERRTEGIPTSRALQPSSSFSGAWRPYASRADPARAPHRQ